MPKRSKTSRPNAAARLAALGFAPGAPVPCEFQEDADFHAMRGEGIDDDPQSFAEFASDENRNLATPARRTLVFVPLAYSEAATALVRGDDEPPRTPCPLPSVAAIAEFVSAFTGLPYRVVAEMPLVPWGTKNGGRGAKNAKAKAGAGNAAGGGGGVVSPPRAFGVIVGSEVIRVRACRASDGEHAVQLNVSDLLDALLAALPDDAYSIIGITPFDIHEDGVPLGGRAYGGSRIACVSLSRYHPSFDDVEQDWPLGERRSVGGPALAAARAAAAAVPPTPSCLSRLWLARVALTAAHEVGHCLGLDHCIYFGCFMGENEGQPPYACPICLRKLFDTTRGGDAAAATAASRYAAIVAFTSTPERADVRMWAAFGAWAKVRLAQVSAGAPGAPPIELE